MPVSMPQFRFPFSKKAQPAAVPTAPIVEEPTPAPAVAAAVDNTAPTTPSVDDSTPRSHRREKSTGSLSIMTRRSREEDTNTYKLSTVNDSGIYLPPSPVDKKAFWGKKETPNGSPAEAPDTQDIGFAITRESFDSYRRSFDISARTQVSDSRRPSMQSSRSSLDALGWGRPSFEAPNRLPSIDVSESASEEDEGEFRDVDLNDQPKKRGFLGRFVPGQSAQPVQPIRPFHTSTPRVVQAREEDIKGRGRPSTAVWRREHNKDAEELSAMVKGSNHLISV
ncbi:hypothetical protein AOL_s00006g180 [Orbilia oligospora ATCC 24927]|uniref:Uncharacterized protein n=2 Tax=Orbilia oligospora TaxID=2813651 RepID=G1WZX9_ARTOA|nr:hypothetical protein AOL_s00006g180 [Orbilia oligospora ATCC 24927]EGX53314.1 hypothetical protein AOL_s00006g180 [Orbilia oligospora ATCC 24927]KAF3291132.1 hypothetical protein TWF970_000371 [Orbilia oligospora]